jgi:regulator of nucleoside diphosphate kinase
MEKKNIYVTDYDLVRLIEMLNAIEADSQKIECSFQQLKQELERAEIVSSAKIPGNVITMNSTVRLKDMHTNEELTFQIVFPSDADLEQGKISILSPVGMALLGYKVGDRVVWNVPSGVRKLEIKEMLYQPEAEGDMYM